MKNINKKSILLLIAVASILLVTVGGTLAYLIDDTTPVVNTFTPSTVDITVGDEVNGGVKSNVTITNSSSIPVYVRVAVVANWCDDTTDNIVAPWNPATHGALPVDTSKWTLESDGYYYYSDKVAANSSVSFFTANGTYKPSNGPANAHLEMDIIAQAVQADGMGAATAQEAFDAAAAQ